MAWAGSIASRAVLRMRSGRVASGPVTLGDAPRTESHVDDRARAPFASRRPREARAGTACLTSTSSPRPRHDGHGGPPQPALTHFDGAYGALRTAARTRAARSARARSRRAAALPVARLRLRPAHRHAAAGVHRRADASRSRCATTASTSALRPTSPHARTVSDVMVETMVAWGVTHVFGMVGHSNLGFADAMRRPRRRGDLTFIGIRHEGAAAFAASAYGKLTGRPAACFAIAGPGLDQPAHRALYDAKVDRAPVLAIPGQVPSKVLGPGAFQDLDLSAAFARRRDAIDQTVHADSDHAELMTLAVKHAIARARRRAPRAPDEVQALPAPGDEPAAPDGPASPTSRSRRPTARSTQRGRAARGRRAAGDHRRPRRAVRMRRRASRWPSASTRRCSPPSRPRA